MNCPTCHQTGDRVTDKRPWQAGGLCGIRRRRECLHCKARFTTLEIIARLGPDGSVILPGLSEQPAPKPKPQKALTAKERDLKKRLAVALYRARAVALRIEGEELLEDPALRDEAGAMAEFERDLELENG